MKTVAQDQIIIVSQYLVIEDGKVIDRQQAEVNFAQIDPTVTIGELVNRFRDAGTNLQSQLNQGPDNGNGPDGDDPSGSPVNPQGGVPVRPSAEKRGRPKAASAVA